METAGKATGMILKIRETVRKIPKGKVSTYGAVAEAAGFPNAPRMVARALAGGLVPWQRVVGSGGRIALPGQQGFEQRFRLEAEGVRFKGKKVDMEVHEHVWKPLRARKNRDG